jgi:hypothetical protein
LWESFIYIIFLIYLKKYCFDADPELDPDPAQNPDPDPDPGEGVGQPKMCIHPGKILGTPLATGLTLIRLPSLSPSTVFSSAKLSRVTPSSCSKAVEIKISHT